MQQFDKKSIFISGGSKGLGAAIVHSLLNSGYQIATFSRTKTTFIEEMEEEHTKNFYWTSVDVTSPIELEQFVDNAKDIFKKIDGLINNAGVAVDGILSMMSKSAIHRMLDTNLSSSLFLTQNCIKSMMIRKSGVIINISSIIGIRGYSGLSVYSATKGALDAMTRSLAREVGNLGIRVNGIAPGYLLTDMSEGLNKLQRQQIMRRTPLNRLGTTEDITGVVQFLLSDAARFIQGQTIVVDGGLTC